MTGNQETQKTRSNKVNKYDGKRLKNDQLAGQLTDDSCRCNP